MRSFNRCLIKALLAASSIIFFCEYLMYYVVLLQCRWPDLDHGKIDPGITLTDMEDTTPVKVMFLSDTHLLGSLNGHWFDKLRREWQMYRVFQTTMTIHKPEVVFVLGDIFDEGLWCSAAEFNRYVTRFNSLFYVPKSTRIYVVAGNHDMGFHYKIIPYLNQRFVNGMKAPNVRKISIRGNHFVLLNSMALEGDGCFLCRPTEIALDRIAKQLQCTKGIGSCKVNDILKQYSRPIILQHYPMYRESDEICHELDEAPPQLKDVKFRERWECLSKEASEQLLDVLKPSWRNKNNPSFLMGVFTPNNYAVSKCYMPLETTMIGIYVLGIISIVIYLVLQNRKIFFRYRFAKLICERP
ncbi:metallophosphoesterase 1 isoform X2 [Athalia rosae]|uniref:metallophosphoesterase 1 isoform X2 n=1 Tax=Athalia rosae TaxID=37344 RepID=UPI00203472C9|nr:metallophosphoesterase 1 isoform X2 [Athalia rosae]